MTILQNTLPVTLREGRAFASQTALARAIGKPAPQIERLVPVGEYLSLAGFTVTWNDSQKKLYATGNVAG